MKISGKHIKADRPRRSKQVRVKSGQMTPIEYIMTVINNPRTPEAKRLELSMFAAPYMDQKKPQPPRQRTRRVGKAAKEPGKKITLSKKAQNGHAKTNWNTDLN